MAHRRVTDQQQKTWDVWEVVPSRVGLGADEQQKREPRISKPTRIVVPHELQSGWLAFQCAEERRRIIPVPQGWDNLPDDALLSMIDAAPQVNRRRTGVS